MHVCTNLSVHVYPPDNIIYRVSVDAFQLLSRKAHGYKILFNICKFGLRNIVHKLNKLHVTIASAHSADSCK